MRPIRTRITIAFAGAFVASMLLFALFLLFARRDAAMVEIAARAQREVNQAVMIIERTRSLANEPVSIEEDSALVTGVGSMLARFLDVVEDYVLILDPADAVLYASVRMRALGQRDSARLVAVARSMADTARVARFSLQNDAVLLAMQNRPITGATRIDRVFVAVSTRAATTAPPQIVGTMLFVGPLLTLLSIWWAYLIAGRTFRPIDRMVDQVQAITDGRSLHRRLAIGAAGTELTRLALTLNEMIERLETSFSALRRFTADASHELKTPLAVLRADVERAMSPTTAVEDRAVALEEALEQVTRMAELVNSLLTLARADEGRLDIVQDLIAADELAFEVLETARLLGEEADIQVDSTTITPAFVRGDLVRLRHLFLNLVTNAIKYSSPGGVVTISLTSSDAQLVFSVQDTGIGIAAADLPYVFDRFWRADRSRSRSSERSGFGLGLAISQWIAHAHGGSLTVQSRLGRGSTFSASLPLAAPPSSAVAEDESPALPAAFWSGHPREGSAAEGPSGNALLSAATSGSSSGGLSTAAVEAAPVDGMPDL